VALFKGKFEIPPPIELGYIKPATRQKLDTFSKHSINLGTRISGIYYSKKDTKVWTMGRYVKYVETSVQSRIDISEVISKYGFPSKIIDLASGQQTFVYDDFSLDIENQKAVKVIYFLYV
jgi:hypothetical protein